MPEKSHLNRIKAIYSFKVYFMKYSILKAAIAISMVMIFSQAFPQTPGKSKKLALIIGIGKYQPGNGWPSIHGDNDVEVMKHALMNAGFAENNISTLKNENATKAGIMAAFKQLAEKAAAGDIVVLHYSGHGQQVSDIDGDEADGLDEALVPYDAPTFPKYGDGTPYEGNKHIADDELAFFFATIRKKIGATGQLVVFIDACHSGTASRGNGVVRGGIPPLILAKSVAKHPGENNEADGSGYMQSAATRGNEPQAKFIMFSAARAEEKDMEYKDAGSLSYALADAFENKLKSPEGSFRDLFEYVRNTMAIIVPSQNPQLEGDKDTKLFGGDVVIQQAFYRVMGINQTGLLEISGGRVLGIAEGTLIGLFPVGTRSATGTPVVSGTVTKSEYLRSFIKTDRKISADSAVKLQAFILSPVFDNAQTKVFIGKIPGELQKKLREQLPAKKIILVQDISMATLIIELNDKNLVEIQNALDKTPVVNPFDHTREIAITACGGDPAGTTDASSYIVSTVVNYARNNIVKNATFSDKNFGLKIRILSAKINPQTNEAELIAQENNFPIFNTVNSQAVLKIENTGSRPGYVYLLEFDPSGKICPLLGFDSEVKLTPGIPDETKIPGFAPPYGRYVIKAYITEEPIGNELTWLINEQNAGTRAAKSNNRLISLLGDLIQNPGSTRGISQDKSGGVSITNFSYDIKEQ
jgi:hypothetical protein